MRWNEGRILADYTETQLRPPFLPSSRPKLAIIHIDPIRRVREELYLQIIAEDLLRDMLQN